MAACTVLVACAQAPTDPAPLLPASEIPLDGLNRRASTLRRRMESRGYGAPVAQTRVFVVEGEGAALPVDVPTGRCATFVALAGGDLHQLDVSLFDGEGGPVAEDRAEGEGGLAHVCPPADAAASSPYYLVLRGRRGTGAVQLMAFVSAPEVGDGFQDLFQGVLAPRVPSSAVADALDALEESLRERSLLPVSPQVVGTLAASGALRATVELGTDHCYVAVAVTGDGVEDADFFLFDPSGAEVARDLERGTNPRLEVCPVMPGRFSFELRAYRGSGAAGFVALEGPRDPSPFPTPGATPQASADAAPQGAGAALAPRIAAMLERGYASSRWLIRDGTLGPGEVRSEEVVLGPGCELLLGGAATGDADLDLYLVDASGRVIDRDTRVRSVAQVAACPDQPTPYRAQVKLYGHTEAFAVAQMEAPASVETISALRLLEAESELLEATPLRSPPSEHELLGTRPVVVAQSVRSQHCVAFAAAGDADILDLDLSLRSETGELLASDTGPAPWAGLRYCPHEDGVLRLELSAYRGSGRASMVRLDAAP